ncbi:SRPBCC family protein [Undibacterium sp.]|uniref:SRPBCC family protein n=1 Tax=Undibacterium sp. TaxID=1914977 RepID=UPI00374DB029
MKFEHLIEINDLNNPMTQVITREQLWRGLIVRAESPKFFVPYLDDCTITERSAQGVSRTLKFGDLIVSDQVQYEALHHVHYDVAAQNDIPHSTLRMTIEEPQPQALFVRFAYDDGHTEAEDAANEMYNEYRRSAYQESDIDTVKVIREMVEEGLLPPALNS